MRENKYDLSAIQLFIIAALLPLLPACNSHPVQPAEKKQVVIKPWMVNEFYHPEDAVFMINVADCYLEGIHMGQMALNKSESPKVRELAKEIHTERKASMEELKRIAERKLVLIPVDFTFKNENKSSALKGKTGLDFDKAYCTMVEMEQRQTIRTFEKQLDELKDTEVKMWASARLPQLRSQLELAIECRKQTDKLNY